MGVDDEKPDSPEGEKPDSPTGEGDSTGAENESRDGSPADERRGGASAEPKPGGAPEDEKDSSAEEHEAGSPDDRSAGEAGGAGAGGAEEERHGDAAGDAGERGASDEEGEGQPSAEEGQGGAKSEDGQAEPPRNPNLPPIEEDTGEPGPVSEAFARVPFAHIVKSHRRASFRLVYLIVIIVVVGLGIWVGWSWWQHRGVAITIEFTHPRSLNVGAPLTLNGVTVGKVEDIELLENQLVNVHARLTASDNINAMIAREGTLFWIPEFKANWTRGLQNIGAVFASKIDVRPGTGPPQYHFTGREAAPPNVWLQDGELPIVLRANSNHGVSDGSIVVYRGLQIGEVVRTQLSRDSTKFEAWLRIRPEYRVLVRKDSHFVDMSGASFQLGFTGLSVSVESLQSLVTGTVALFTPTKYGPPASPGAEFPLELTVKDEYRSWDPYIEFTGYESMYEATTAAAPRVSKATLTWSHRRLWGIMAPGEGMRQGLVLMTSAGVLAPLNMLTPPSSSDTNPRLNFDSHTVVPDAATITWSGNGLGMCEVKNLESGWSVANMRPPSEPESCTIYGPGASQIVVNREYLKAEDGTWTITGPATFNAGWDGAAVISTHDGKLIGLLVVGDNTPANVHPIPATAPFLTGN